MATSSRSKRIGSPVSRHAAVELDPAIRLVGHHFPHLLPDHVRDTGVGGVGWVCLDVNVVAQRAVGSVEELDDAEALVDVLEQGAVARLAFAQRLLGAPTVGDVKRDPNHALGTPS